MAMNPALIAGHAHTANPWREVVTVIPAAHAEPTADTATRSPDRTLDMSIELRSVGRLTHRLASVFGTSSIGLLWATNWLSSAGKTASIPAVPIGVATSVLAILSAIIALGLELLTRVRLERAPKLTTLQEHRLRIEAESAAFRDSLPTAPQRQHRPPPRRRRLGRPR
jgi:hypothetical protein